MPNSNGLKEKRKIKKQKKKVNIKIIKRIKKQNIRTKN